MNRAQELRYAELLARRSWIRWYVDAFMPVGVRRVMERISAAGGEAYAVGGSVRDLLLGRRPDDWDLATSLTPREVMGVFRRTLPTGVEHGTVTVVTARRHVEVTTFRTEGEYSDHRHPDWVAFTRELEEDLGRRDFTINAVAMDRWGCLTDPFGGLGDMARGLIRTVGDPAERFGEDALRMVRAVRFAAQLGFSVHESVMDALEENAPLVDGVSVERVRAELDRLLSSTDPAGGIELLRKVGLLERFWPELCEGVGVEQNPHHAYTVWEHSLNTLGAMARETSDLSLRLAALLHDVAKPRCLSTDAEGMRHFYNHHVVGAAVARRMLVRLRYDNRTIDRVTHLIRHHMALHHYPDMKDAAIRRLVNRVGVANMDDLVALRTADREGSGTKDTPLSRGTLRLLERVDRVLAEDAAFSLKDLAVDGHDVMRVGGLDPGPGVGRILNRLLDEVLEDPSLNTRLALKARIRELVDSGEVPIESS